MLLRARACLVDVIQALSWMPRGASKLRISAQYALGIVVLRSFPDACLHSIRAMVVKQGIVSTDAGKGELNSALSGLGQISGIVMPGSSGGRCSASSARAAGASRRRGGCGGARAATTLCRR